MFDSISAGSPASARTLAALCDRLAISLEAGIDVRRVWRSEASRNRGRAARVCAEVADDLEQGVGLDQAIADAGAFFPPLFVEMTRVGEQTGSSVEVFRRLAKHYQNQVAHARNFRSAIAWPVLQLLAALAIVAVLIAIGGVLKNARGEPLDMLGLGLVGTRGLMIYLNSLMGVALLLGLAWTVIRRQPEWGARLRGFASRVPGIGSVFQKLSLARIAWALRLMLNVEMDLRGVGPIALRASDNAFYAQHGEAVAGWISRGLPLSESFGQTRVFPREFLDTLEVAEQAGTIVESMDRLTRQYEEEAESAIHKLSIVLATVVWAGVACLVILLIFRVFSFYTGILEDALEGL
ncbi:Type II secretion system protein F [Planctomycetes bacterium MalM25]|nr:Type II secretion system protein F [Planctomycetes bacterium MalM25]